MDLNFYDALGEEGLSRIVGSFYARVRADDLLSPMYPADDWEGAEGRLRDFLIQRFGGPQRYSEIRGHPRLRMRHAPYQLDEAARDRWCAHMAAAIEEAEVDPAVARPMLDFLEQTATFLRNA